MKRSLILASLMILVPVIVSAQIPMMPGAIEFSANGGASVPFGDFNTIADPGYGIGGTAAFYAMPNLAVGGSIAYNSYAMDPAFGADLKMAMWEMTGYGKYLFMPGPVTPYAKAAFGMFRTKVDGSPSSTNDMGIGGGLGAQLRLPTSNIGFFAEGMAYSVFSEGSSANYYAVRGGINFYISPTP